jgi:hypothetical protein
VNKQREERAEAEAEAKAEVDEKADGDAVDSLICAYEFRMRMGERDSAIDAETQSRRSMAKVGDDWRRRYHRFNQTTGSSISPSERPYVSGEPRSSGFGGYARRKPIREGLTCRRGCIASRRVRNVKGWERLRVSCFEEGRRRRRRMGGGEDMLK